MKGFEAISLAAAVLLCMVLLLLGIPDRYLNSLALASIIGTDTSLGSEPLEGCIKIDESFRSAKTLDAVLERYIIKQASR